MGGGGLIPVAYRRGERKTRGEEGRAWRRVLGDVRKRISGDVECSADAQCMYTSSSVTPLSPLHG